MSSIKEAFENLGEAFNDLTDAIIESIEDSFYSAIKPFKELAKEKRMPIYYVPDLGIMCRCSLLTKLDRDMLRNSILRVEA